jgi:hypothetical protein
MVGETGFFLAIFVDAKTPRVAVFIDVLSHSGFPTVTFCCDIMVWQCPVMVAIDKSHEDDPISLAAP